MRYYKLSKNILKKEKSGKYNRERRLPDNNMQPRKSGLYVWLNEQVIQLYGPGLVAESQLHGDRRYWWLLTGHETRPPLLSSPCCNG